MAFSDFQSIEQVIQKYPLKVRQERFIPEIELALPEWFIENLNFSLDTRSVTGLIWEFAKLESEVFTKHPISYSISEPNRVFGILDFIFSACEAQLN